MNPELAEYKMKKFIAREGLIILSIALLVGLLVLIMEWFDIQARKEILFVPLDESTIHKYEEGGISLSRSTHLKFATRLHKENHIRKQQEHENVYRSYESTTMYIILFLTFVLYPGYLIVRFTIWAIRALRSENS
jgi:hypothetical protein